VKLYVLYGSQKQPAIISIRRIGWLVSVSMTECVYCAVRSASLNRIQLWSAANSNTIHYFQYTEWPCTRSSVVKSNFVFSALQRLTRLICIVVVSNIKLMQSCTACMYVCICIIDICRVRLNTVCCWILPSRLSRRSCATVAGLCASVERAT